MRRIISYDLNGGEIPSDFKLVTEWSFSSRRTLPIPVREGGAVFVGWFVDGKKIENLGPSVVYNGMTVFAEFSNLEPEKGEPPAYDVDTDEEDIPTVLEEEGEEEPEEEEEEESEFEEGELDFL